MIKHLGLVFACVGSLSASELSISIGPNTNNVRAYYFPDRASAEGQVIHIKKSLTVICEIIQTNKNWWQEVPPDDVFSIGGYQTNGRCWTSFNVYKPSRTSFAPNLHDCNVNWNGAQVNVNTYGQTNRVWRRLGTSFTKTSTNYVVSGCEGTNYSTSLASASGPNFPYGAFYDVDVMLIFTNTLTSYCDGRWEVRNIWIFDSYYTDASLRMMVLNGVEGLDLSKQVVIQCTGLKTNVPASDPYMLQYSTNATDWKIISSEIYTRPPWGVGCPTNATIVIPFYTDPQMSLFRLWKRYEQKY